jgi:hypothetical protein
MFTFPLSSPLLVSHRADMLPPSKLITPLLPLLLLLLLSLPPNAYEDLPARA